VKKCDEILPSRPNTHWLQSKDTPEKRVFRRGGRTISCNTKRKKSNLEEKNKVWKKVIIKRLLTNPERKRAKDWVTKGKTGVPLKKRTRQDTIGGERKSINNCKQSAGKEPLRKNITKKPREVIQNRGKGGVLQMPLMGSIRGGNRKRKLSELGHPIRRRV